MAVFKTKNGVNGGERGMKGDWEKEGDWREKGRREGKGFGVEKQDLNPAGAVTAPTVWCREDRWLFSYQH